ncbi:hypothetical protein HOA55_01015 [archaeon]|jgi:hypothetical protein|nr:hypothetical protein [archaeon]MBT3577540.1 hypothetical protein [archaeon]MBT6819915.1 hypothetical protein [archaeon]MBT6956675.1 hypothetical protein [archaeon]MBT7025071.1 hypothetical protein [archaeon]
MAELNPGKRYPILPMKHIVVEAHWTEPSRRVLRDNILGILGGCDDGGNFLLDSDVGAQPAHVESIVYGYPESKGNLVRTLTWEEFFDRGRSLTYLGD